MNIKFFDKTGGDYEDLPLPDLFRTDYLLECVYGNWSGSNKQFINFEVLLLNEFGKFNAFISICYGSKFTLAGNADVLITFELLKKYPALRKFVSKKL